MNCADGVACPNMERIEGATYVMSAIRAVSDLLCNSGLTDSMNMVKPENLEALMTILADRLEAELSM